MELSIREAKARFSEAASAAARGERVVVTKQGQPFIEWIPAKPVRPGFDWDKAKRVAKELGLARMPPLPDDFNDPAFSRRVLGLED